MPWRSALCPVSSAMSMDHLLRFVATGMGTSGHIAIRSPLERKVGEV
jgi:hypothetical protein